VNADHRVEVGLRHVPDGGGAHDSGDVDDDVARAEGIDGLLDELPGLLEVRQVGVVGDGRATSFRHERTPRTREESPRMSSPRTGSTPLR
jgi:hypothetical protein